MADSVPSTNGASSQTAKPSSPAPGQNANAASTPSASQQQQQQGQESKYYTTSETGPITSLTDSGTSTRPRDARTIHMVLAALGVTAYQERVPLQLLDFAYRYTNSILSDAQHLVAEGYVGQSSGTTGGSKAAQAAAAAAAAKDGEIPLSAIRLATSSRLGFAYSNTLPKESLLQLAADKNKTKLPDVGKELVFGVRLPHERYVMTGTGWNLAEEWDSEADDDNETGALETKDTQERRNGTGLAPATNTMEDNDEEMEDEFDDQDGFEQVFGKEGGADGADKEDKAMSNT